MIRFTLALATTFGLVTADASAKDCMGTFLRDSCATAGGRETCSFPRRKGSREEFMGWEIDAGVRAYAVYRLAAYPAADIRIDRGCRLGRY